MWNKFFLLFIISTTFFNRLLSNTISNELLGIQLGTEYKTLAKNYKFVKIKNEKSGGKIYKIVYSETFGIETYLYFFNSKVYKIKVVYEKNFADESDWENIFNQTKFNYGEYSSSVTNSDYNNYTETYTWQDENVKQVLEKVSNNNVLEKFSVYIIDKKLEKKILNMTPLEKFWQKIISIF